MSESDCDHGSMRGPCFACYDRDLQAAREELTTERSFRTTLEDQLRADRDRMRERIAELEAITSAPCPTEAERDRYRAALEDIRDRDVKRGLCMRCGRTPPEPHDPGHDCGIAQTALRGGA